MPEAHSHQSERKGYFPNGLPFTRLGNGPRPLVVFQGLLFENKPHSPLVIQPYRFLTQTYTIYSVLRKPNLPAGYSLADMAEDYAEMIRDVFGGPVDVIGLSTGGSIAQHFAADHPDLVRRLILHSTAYRLSDSAKALQLELARLARDEKWFRANALFFETAFPAKGVGAALARPLIWLGAGLMTLNAPEDPHDLVVTIMAEDAFNFKDRLGEITAPTLVAGGTADPFYSPALFQETAAGIPDARLGLYAGAAHPAAGKAFEADVRAFLNLPGADQQGGEADG